MFLTRRRGDAEEHAEKDKQVKAASRLIAVARWIAHDFSTLGGGTLGDRRGAEEAEESKARNEASRAGESVVFGSS